MSATALIKFCGLTRLRDVEVAGELDAAAVGFVLCRSCRQVSPEDLPALLEATPEHILRVAVMGAPTSELVELVNRLPFDALQCELGDQAPPRLRGERFLLPAFRDSAQVAMQIAAYRERALSPRSDSPFEAAVLLDGPAGGGRGIRPDSQRARALAREGALILAGGLSPDNGAESYRQGRPLGVDVSSGIEHTRGHKDPQRMARFAANLRAQNEPTEQTQPAPESPLGNLP